MEFSVHGRRVAGAGAPLRKIGAPSEIRILSRPVRNADF
jgi:hypothetical protein